MFPLNSRRSFLKFIPGSAVALFAAGFAHATPAQTQSPPPSNRPVPMSGPGMGGGAGNSDITRSANGSSGRGPGYGQGQSQSGAGSPAKPPSFPDDGKANPLAVPRMSLTEAQKDMRQNVEQLAKIAEDLKQEVEKTDSTKVLSLDVVHKTEEIEKLARHIGSLAKG